jgi:hypothetical protein
MSQCRPLILGALLLRQLAACKIISIDQQKLAGIVSITDDKDTYGVLQFLGPYYKSPKPLNNKPVYQSDPVVDKEATSFLFYDAAEGPNGGSWKISRNNPWVNIIGGGLASKDHLGAIRASSWLSVHSNANMPLDIDAGSSWQVASWQAADILNSDGRMSLNNIHLQVNCADGRTPKASSAPTNLALSELHLQLRFFKESVDSFTEEKQRNFITSLRAVVADRIIQEYEQGRVEIQQYKLKILVAKISLEQEVLLIPHKVTTPAISCANAPGMPQSSKDGWYPCDLKLAAMDEKLLLPQPDIVSVIVDARLQSSHFVINQMVSMVKDTHFPRDLALTFDANPDAQLNGRIEVSEAEVEQKLWVLPSRGMHYHRISHDSQALASRAVNDKKQQLMEALTKASQRRRHHHDEQKSDAQHARSIIPPHVAKHVKWHHWTLVLVAGFLFSVLLTVYKAHTLFSKEGMRTRRVQRARSLATTALHARHTRRPMRSKERSALLSVGGSKGGTAGSLGGTSTRRRPSAGGGRSIDI